MKMDFHERGRSAPLSFIRCLLLAVLVVTGCRRDMFEQPKSEPLGQNDFFANGMDSRPIPPHTVARNGPLYDETFDTGMIGTNLVTTFPYPITREILERGQQRFEINCVPCHGQTGEGNGIVVQRGFPAPPSYHIDRLRSAPIGHFFDVMTRGYGVMYSYASRVTPEDRWAIAAYIRALQLSESATPADVPANELAKLEAAP
ncbi:MAG TPA: cytochrome c [Verrucomicrobiae bacterium]|jgi:mono/diheme cytochrome c family protein